MSKFLDITGLSYFWNKTKQYIVQYVNDYTESGAIEDQIFDKHSNLLSVPYPPQQNGNYLIKFTNGESEYIQYSSPTSSVNQGTLNIN